MSFLPRTYEVAGRLRRFALFRSESRFPTGLLQVASLIVIITAGVAAQGADIRRDAVVAAVEKVLPAVVNVATLTVERADPYEEMLREFFGYRRRNDAVQSSGSGVIIDEEGWVLTNLHVVRDARRVRVTIADNSQSLDAEVVSVSEANDLALLRLKSEPGQQFRSVAFAPDDDLLLGETVLALGNPYGLGGSVSRGILSSKTRRPETDGETMRPEDWLQTDASINPGNSGGPLINLRGELIGLNVAILANAQGIGFAIPVKRIATSLAQMFSPEMTKGLWFGATVRGVKTPLLVTEIQRGSPAETAGLEAGDQVVTINGRPATSFLQFYREITSGNQEARLGVVREDRRYDIRVRLLAERAVFNADYVRRRLGISLEPLPEDVQRQLERQLRMDLSAAMLISAVERKSTAEAAGIVAGQILLGMDGQPVPNVVAVGRLLNRRPSGEGIELKLLTARRRGVMVQVSEATVTVKLR